jgi:hypothetical protein
MAVSKLIRVRVLGSKKHSPSARIGRDLGRAVEHVLDGRARELPGADHVVVIHRITPGYVGP